MAGEGPPPRPRVKPHCLERMELTTSGFRIGTCPGSGRHLASRGTPKSTASPCTAQPRGDAEWQGELGSLAKTNSTQAETADFLWNSPQFLPTPHPYFRCLSPSVLLLSPSGVSSSPHPLTEFPLLSHPPPLPRLLPPSLPGLCAPFPFLFCNLQLQPQAGWCMGSWLRSLLMVGTPVLCW